MRAPSTRTGPFRRFRGPPLMIRNWSQGARERFVRAQNREPCLAPLDLRTPRPRGGLLRARAGPHARHRRRPSRNGRPRIRSAPSRRAAGGRRGARRPRPAGHAGEGAAGALALLRPAPVRRRQPSPAPPATSRRPGFSERDPVSTGVGGKKGTRKAPPVLNAAFPIYPVWFWDGRASSLAEQAKGPMENPVEMGMTHAGSRVRRARHSRLPALLRRGLRRRAHRRRPGRRGHRGLRGDAASPATRPTTAGTRATRRPSTRSRSRASASSSGKAACNQCHLGPNLTDSRFHNLGVGWRPPAPGADPASGFADPGRAKVTGKAADTGAFKTPTLRDVSRRAPYMHDGSVATLREAVLLYDRGGTPEPLALTRGEAPPPHGGAGRRAGRLPPGARRRGVPGRGAAQLPALTPRPVTRSVGVSCIRA